jgi:hypothetical protein
MIWWGRGVNIECICGGSHKTYLQTCKHGRLRCRSKSMESWSASARNFLGTT